MKDPFNSQPLNSIEYIRLLDTKVYNVFFCHRIAIPLHPINWQTTFRLAMMIVTIFLYRSFRFKICIYSLSWLHDQLPFPQYFSVTQGRWDIRSIFTKTFKY